jgi:O-antigen/teichoic acid export membrane protein
VFPALAAAGNKPDLFVSIARRAVHAVSLVTLPMAFGIMLLPDKIIHVLGYPVSFDNSVIPLIFLAPHLPLAAIDTVIGTVLNARDRQRQWALIGVAAAVLNPLINMFVIPYAQATWGNGAIGAAAVTTATEVFMMVNGLRLLPKDVLRMSTTTNVAKCVFACGVMGASVWLTRDLPIAVPILAGVIAYAATCLAVGAVSIGDLQEIRVQLVRGRTPTQAAAS